MHQQHHKENRFGAAESNDLLYIRTWKPNTDLGWEPENQTQILDGCVNDQPSVHQRGIAQSVHSQDFPELYAMTTPQKRYRGGCVDQSSIVPHKLYLQATSQILMSVRLCRFISTYTYLGGALMIINWCVNRETLDQLTVKSRLISVRTRNQKNDRMWCLGGSLSSPVIKAAT